MRTRALLVTALSLLGATAARAQVNTPPPEPAQNTGISTLGGLGQADFGFRGTAFSDDSDEARYQRYEDLRNGVFAERIRWGAVDEHKYWDVHATKVGYRDQEYAANYNQFGKLRASFAFNQIPLFFSQTTRTAYSTQSPGVLALDGYPQQIEGGAATSAVYNDVADPFDMRLKRSIIDFRASYSLTEHLDLSAVFKNILKSGEQPWAGTFGFSNAVELPVPVDTRTTDVGVAAEWTGGRGLVRVGYDGSFFHNNITTLIWDNPLRSTDNPSAGPARGRMAVWPNSNLNTGSVSGVFKVTDSSQATGYVSLGQLSQDDALIPFTINSALTPPALDRAHADASARITATAFTFNTRPLRSVWLNARFRSYDFDNQTPVFHVTDTVSYDTKVAPYDLGSNSVFSFTRKLTDLEASWSPLTFVALRAGYSYDKVNQTFRTFDSTSEHTVRLSADATGLTWLTVRGLYEYSKRVGTGVDEQSLDNIGEQTSLRQFDISDRNVNRFSAIVLASLSSAFSVNGTASVGRDSRPASGFGLLDYDTNGVSVGFDYVPASVISVGASYQYERYTSLQKSRQADPGPQFDDPTRDWTTTGADRAHTLTASADLLKLWQDMDVRVAYDFVHAESSYIYGLTQDTTLPPVSQLPQVWNTRNRVSADARYMLNTHWGVGLAYRYEKFSVDDFAFNPATLNTVSQPSFVSLQYTLAPYTANTIWVRATYHW